MKKFDTTVFEKNSLMKEYRHTVKNFTRVFNFETTDVYVHEAQLTFEELAAEFWKAKSLYLENATKRNRDIMETLERFATLDHAFTYDVNDNSCSCCSW